MAGIWADDTALLATFPEERRDQRIHVGHCRWAPPDEERFLTPQVLGAVCMIGTRDQLLKRLHALADAGLDQVMILPSFDTRYDVLEVGGAVGRADGVIVRACRPGLAAEPRRNTVASLIDERETSANACHWHLGVHERLATRSVAPSVRAGATRLVSARTAQGGYH